MLRQLILLMVTSLAARPTAAQTAAAQFTGVILDESGRPLAGARVVCTGKARLVPGSDGGLRAAAAQPQVSLQAITNASGRYQVSGLPPGDYDFCMDAPGYLATCEWTGWRRATVAQAQALDNGTVQLMKAATVTIQINDPLRLLPPPNKMVAPLVVGVRDRWGRFHPGRETASNGDLHVFQVDVPYGTALNVWLHSWRFRLSDSNGTAVNQAGAQFPFQVPGNGIAPTYAFTIAGEAGRAR
jgi:hypothetical protein